MTSPLLSVCIVTYNQDFFIHKVLESAVTQQTDFTYEIVVGEDCSSDNTYQICQDYANRYPDIIHLLPSPEHNLGLKLNFLRTFQACHGKYIAYLEGDDFWITPDKLQKQVNILEMNPDVVLVHTNCKVWDVKHNIVSDHLIQYDGVCIREQQSGISGVIAEFKGEFRHIKTSTCVYRRATMEDILREDEFAYTNKEFPAQDFQLFQDMAFNGRFAFVDEDTTMIALTDSLSANSDTTKLFRYREGFNKIGIYYLNKYHIDQDVAQIWMQKELHWHLNFGMHHPEHSDDIMQIMNVAQTNGYRVPLTQKLLLFLLKHPRLRSILYPLYRVYYTHRES